MSREKKALEKMARDLANLPPEEVQKQINILADEFERLEQLDSIHGIKSVRQEYDHQTLKVWSKKCNHTNKAKTLDEWKNVLKEEDHRSDEIKPDSMEKRRQ